MDRISLCSTNKVDCNIVYMFDQAIKVKLRYSNYLDLYTTNEYNVASDDCFAAIYKMLSCLPRIWHLIILTMLKIALFRQNFIGECCY